MYFVLYKNKYFQSCVTLDTTAQSDQSLSSPSLSLFLSLSPMFLDVQFWRSRKSLEGLSVRSVFFNVFQSFIVLLYIMDNETNTMVVVMVFIGLCIDVWKVTKVSTITLDRENLIAGIIPRLSFVDQPSYVESSTKKYDKV